MPSIALDTTLSGTTSNSYVDVDYASGYWEQHFDTTKQTQWAALTATQQTMLLFHACRVLETARFTVNMMFPDYSKMVYDRRSRNVVFLNETTMPAKYYQYQHLQFPRTIDRNVITGELYVPEEIKAAQCEQAMYIMTFDDSIISNTIQGIDHDGVSVGDIRIRQVLRQGGSFFSPVALELIKPYLIKTSSAIRRG
jgi:hypothetical protein